MLNRLHINETLIQRETSIIWFICISLGTIYEPIDHVIFCHHTLTKPTKKHQENMSLIERREEHYSNYFVQSSSSLFHDAESEFQSPYQSDSVRLVLVRINESPRGTQISWNTLRMIMRRGWCHCGASIRVGGSFYKYCGGFCLALEWHCSSFTLLLSLLVQTTYLFE